MNIAYVCSDPGIPICGTKGAAIHVRELSQALHALGHQVLIVTPRAGGQPPPHFDVPVREFALDAADQATIDLLAADPSAGAPIVRAVRGILSATSLRDQARETVCAFAPDAIYERYSLFGTAGLALARQLNIPRILEVNAPLSEEQAAHRGLGFPEAARELERMILCSAEHVIAVSSEVERWLVGLGVEPERIAILPNAVDVARFEAADGEREALRSRLDVGGRPVVGFLGTLKPWHDTAALIRAAGMLCRRGTRPQWLIVGDGPERGRLEELARREGVEAMTTFTGAVPHEQVPAYLAALDVAAAPYPRTEHFYFSPLKLYEYLGAGRPVVAADIGQIRDCIRPGATGLLYPPGDVAALADAIEALVDDNPLRVSLGRAGREHAREHHSWEANAAAVVRLAAQLGCPSPGSDGLGPLAGPA